MNLAEYEKTMETINAIITSGGIAEVKIEKTRLVVVEVGRSVRSAEDIKENEQ